MSALTATLYEPGYLIAGKYELEAQLGQGGMGVVWRARNVALDSLVALKVLRASKDKALLQGRLMQEARAAAKLRHPAIVKVFDVGQTEAGDPFIVMELLQGDSLGKILEADGRLPAVQVVRSLLPIVDALWLAHTKGIVHRDLKPDNVFIVQHDGSIQPTLVDFGIAKLQDADIQSHLTQAGDVLGSPDYMSPEQARGQDDVGHLSDIWSICVVLYEAIVGRTPFQGNNYNALLRQIVEETPPSPRELAAADDELSAIIMRGLSKGAEQRFVSMGELGRALANWLVQQGVTEDICGSTLEAKWLRGTEPHGRAGRATLTSLNDAWPVESGSGVRRNELGPVNTLRAPPRSEAAPTSQPTDSVAPGGEEPPGVRPKWRAPAAAVGVVLLALAGFALARSLLSSAPAPAAASAQLAPTAPSPATAASAPVPAEEPTAEAPLAHEKRAQTGDEQVSSSPGSAPSRAPRARSVPSPKKGTSSSAKAKPADLISPY